MGLLGKPTILGVAPICLGFERFHLLNCHGLLSEKIPAKPKDSQGRRCCDEFGSAIGFTSIMVRGSSVPHGNMGVSLGNLYSCHYRCGEDVLEILCFCCLPVFLFVGGITCRHYLVFVDFWLE